MSRIDDLIAELCPEGVAYRELGEIAETIAGLTGKTKADFTGGNVRYISYKNVFANLAVDQKSPDYVRVGPHEKQNMLMEGDVVITGSSESLDEVGMSSVVEARPNEPLYLNSFCFCVRFRDSLAMIPGFSKYLFRSELVRSQIRRTANGVTRINISKSRFLKIRIPVPPLEVQREIVRILDTFTELEAELEAELETRRQQYEHYRDQLIVDAGHSGERLILADLGKIVTGRTPKSSDTASWGDYLDFITPSDINDGMKELSNPIRRISRSAADSMAKVVIPARSILVTCIGTVGKTVINSHECVTNQQINSIVLEDGIDADFLFHLLASKRSILRIQGERGGGTMPIINKSDFSKIEVSIPPLDVQRSVASKLNALYSLVNDLRVGLPAELNARRKQYEYYRDKLLTFEEAPA